MALYRDIQFNKGTTTDLMGAIGTVTGATFNKDKKGWVLQTGYLKYLSYDKQLLPNNAFSVVVWAKISDNTVIGTHPSNIISYNTSGTRGICISHYSFSGLPMLYLSNGNYCAFNWTPNKRWHCFIFTITGSTINDIDNSKLYVDNVNYAISNISKTQIQELRSTYLYSGGSNLATGGGSNISRIKVYDHVLTSKEREKEQIEFEAAQPLTYQKRLLSLPKPTELKQSGLIAGYNKIRSGVYNDLSVLGKHGVVTNCLSTIKGIKLHGVNSKVVLGNISNVKSISFRIKLKTTTQPILEKASNNGLIHVLSGILTSLDFANKYVNGVVGTVITANQWHNVTLTSSTDVNFSAATLGLNNTTYGNFEIEDLRFYSTILSLQEIKAYHNSFNEVILQESFNDMAVGASKLPSGWIKNGGIFVCNESTTNDSVIKSIRKGTKYLKCVTAGIVAIPCKWVNGQIEFSWYKGGDNNRLNFGFINDSVNLGISFVSCVTNGYYLSITEQEVITSGKNNKGLSAGILYATVSSYITNNTWYRVRKTISNTGVRTTYLLGGNFTTWTLVSTTGGSGSNPVTDNTYNSSNYFVMDLDANDRVTDILIQSQIKA